MENSYTKLAKVYNLLNNDCDYEKWSQYLLNELQPSFKQGIDICCGTGIISNILSKHYNIIGIDKSVDMLNVASIYKNKNLTFICQDMLQFEVFKNVDFITCICDGVNYIKSISLVETFFKKVYNQLNSGGVFLFDISSQYKFNNVLANNFFYDNSEEISYIWINELNKNSIKLDISFFVYNGKNYDRFDEEHTQYIYTQQDITKVLSNTGFEVKAYGDIDKTEVNENSLRIHFVARKA